MFSDNKGIKLYINKGKISRKILKKLKLNNTHVNKPWLEENILNWIKIETSLYQNLCDAT